MKINGMGLLKDMTVPVQVVLGEAELTVEELTRFAEGVVIQLRTLAGEPVHLTAAGRTIAHGEVVVIDENFGIRLTSIENGEE
jgi:flagellar motor switch protein FliN